ncbi:GDSL-type esterase/lipase family protein [Methylotetracoccus oryzae]|uniref:GDSL-type esterase/lipase family protein n=1 Tax=Methylotetracoccus oryzae TaxID=1919059 RepID=UPI00111BB39C|nr:GDSL-type esterase/lipase family protein [Methylotetracoccus oryzae]
MHPYSLSQSTLEPIRAIAFRRGCRLPLWLAFLLLTACGDGGPRLPALYPDASIIAFGDSITSGVGAAPGQDYPSQLARLTGFRVTNAGVPMEVSAEGLARLPALLDQNPADLLILIHGGNDFLRHLPQEQTAANLKAMIAEARSRGISVVMLGVPQPALFGLSSAEFYKQVADATGTPIDGETLPAILSDNSLKSDLVHPNDEGYHRLAEATASLLRASGAWSGAVRSND